MNLGLSYVDATNWDLELRDDAIECKKFSAPFLVLSRSKEEVVLKGLADGTLWQKGLFDDALLKGSVYERKVPLSVFQARFEAMTLEGRKVEKVCCLTQPITRAIEMPCSFGVLELAEDAINFVKVQGEVGDYLLRGPLGANQMVKREDFLVKYQRDKLDQSLCPSVKIKMALRKMATYRSGHDMTM